MEIRYNIVFLPTITKGFKSRSIFGQEMRKIVGILLVSRDTLNEK